MECDQVQEAVGAFVVPERFPLQKAMPAPKCMQDGSAAVAEEMEEVNLSDYPALGAKPVVQPRRNYHPNDEQQIKQEVEKLLASGFIKPIKHPTWLENIVPVKKKNGQIRVCVDFRDLNKQDPAIASHPPPSSQKELKSFLGRLSYIRRFIPGLAAVTQAFTPLLKKANKFTWNAECKEAYLKVQQLITKLPTMKAPTPGVPLKVYLASTNAVVGALLAQDGEAGEEFPIYNVSKLLRGAETRYPKAERLCLALVYVAQRLRHYFLAHKLQLMVKTDLVRYLLTKPVLSGRLARGLLQLSEFDIVCTTPRAIMGQAVIDMITLFPEEEGFDVSHDILRELLGMTAVVEEEEPWTLHFDESAMANGGGARVVLVDPKGHAKPLSFKLNFSCTNNVAEYEAFIAGLATAHELRVKKIRVIEDSNLVISQLKGDFAVKEVTLAPYRTLAEKLIKKFEQITLEHIPGSTNRYADTLATLGSKLSFTREQPNITVIQNNKPCVEAMIFSNPSSEKDWREFVKDEMAQLDKEDRLRTLGDYSLIFGELYKRLPGGVLARCVDEKEAQRRLQEVHEATCGVEQVVSLYRRLQRRGYYWPDMKKQAAETQLSCSKCSSTLSEQEGFTAAITEDWRSPYLEYLISKTLPENRKHAYKVKKMVKRYFVDGSTLYRK
ncbi:uncharacterized protein LOC112164363 [Rosa chinensis]|uniref:uncharacterized protein LOC112164363 n=1 Tax=Rosa chinensis TaxID=74649 RepID=UPI000D089645|nr:uncharacterized protein LOC112164363 [Rosa chinensis]